MGRKYYIEHLCMYVYVCGSYIIILEIYLCVCTCVGRIYCIGHLFMCMYVCGSYILYWTFVYVYVRVRDRWSLFACARVCVSVSMHACVCLHVCIIYSDLHI